MNCHHLRTLHANALRAYQDTETVPLPQQLPSGSTGSRNHFDVRSFSSPLLAGPGDLSPFSSRSFAAELTAASPKSSLVQCVRAEPHKLPHLVGATGNQMGWWDAVAQGTGSVTGYQDILCSSLPHGTCKAHSWQCRHPCNFVAFQRLVRPVHRLCSRHPRLCWPSSGTCQSRVHLHAARLARHSLGKEHHVESAR